MKFSSDFFCLPGFDAGLPKNIKSLFELASRTRFFVMLLNMISKFRSEKAVTIVLFTTTSRKKRAWQNEQLAHFVTGAKSLRAAWETFDPVIFEVNSTVRISICGPKGVTKDQERY